MMWRGSPTTRAAVAADDRTEHEADAEEVGEQLTAVPASVEPEERGEDSLQHVGIVDRSRARTTDPFVPSSYGARRGARRRDATPVRSGVRSRPDYSGTFVPPPGGTQCPSPRHAEARVLARAKPGRAGAHRARLPAVAVDGDRPGAAAVLPDHDHQRRQGSRARCVAGRDVAGQRRLQRHQHGHVRCAHGGRGRLRHRRTDPGHLVARGLRQGRALPCRRPTDGQRRGLVAVPRCHADHRVDRRLEHRPARHRRSGVPRRPGRDLPVPARPTSAFTATPMSGPEPLDVSFNASGSTSPGATITGYSWSFGGSGALSDHTFPAGTYVVPDGDRQSRSDRLFERHHHRDRRGGSDSPTPPLPLARRSTSRGPIGTTMATRTGWTSTQHSRPPTGWAWTWAGPAHASDSRHRAEPTVDFLSGDQQRLPFTATKAVAPSRPRRRCRCHEPRRDHRAPSLVEFALVHHRLPRDPHGDRRLRHGHLQVQWRVAGRPRDRPRHERASVRDGGRPHVLTGRQHRDDNVIDIQKGLIPGSR